MCRTHRIPLVNRKTPLERQILWTYILRMTIHYPAIKPGDKLATVSADFALRLIPLPYILTLRTR